MSYLFRMLRKCYPLLVKFARNQAYVIMLQRASVFQIPATDRNNAHHLGKKWPQAFYKRYLELKAIRMKAIDWERHDCHIYDKVVDWFLVIRKELGSSTVLIENSYNMDETGVLVSKNELKAYKGAGVKRTFITAIESIFADGWYLHSLII